ncbi:MAG: hypothetical protein PW843_08965 [Azospirillaceae bacterium]|nr:hypothetical protein [Azospirillaceae bacterium]
MRTSTPAPAPLAMVPELLTDPTTPNTFSAPVPPETLPLIVPLLIRVPMVLMTLTTSTSMAPPLVLWIKPVLVRVPMLPPTRFTALLPLE